MKLTAKQLQAQARRKHAALTKKRKDIRYQTVMGRLVSAGLLSSTETFTHRRRRIRVRDALWAGEIEPRILELLPALLVKRPALFEDPSDCPADLEAVVQALKRNRTPEDFRGIEGAALARWVPLLGKRGKLPSRLMSFRMTDADVKLLTRLSESLALNNTEVIRRALRVLAGRELLDRHE